MSAPYPFLGLNPMQSMQGPHVSIQGMPPVSMASIMPGLNLNPMTNDQPLQFNKNKGKPPMPILGGEITEVKDMDLEKTAPDNMLSSNPDMPGMMGPMMHGGMGFNPLMTNPNMMGMMNQMAFGQFPGFMGPMPPMGMPNDMNVGPGPSEMPRKEVLTCKECTLVPPPPGAPPPSTRERPPGCRTIFVGGLPENGTEDMLADVFEHCGSIVSIRLSKKNFAHIRFETCDAVDRSIYLSGYRMKIENKDDKPNTGRLHVDFAQARDDLYEFECLQRQMDREMRHHQRMEEDRLRPPSPPPVVHYSEHEASALSEKLKDDDSFMKAAQLLMTWLDRGDCTQRSANRFYSMIQCVNSHIRRLMNEKVAHEEELQKAKEACRFRMQGILRQLDQIEKVFTVASKQKAWDHFSKAQRKNLDIWRKQTQEIKTSQQEDFLKDRQEDEMEMSDNEDGDGPAKKKMKGDNNFSMDQAINQYKEENDALKCQLEAYKNEVDLLKLESKHSLDLKDSQIKALQQALQGMQQQLIRAKQEQDKKPDKDSSTEEKSTDKSNKVEELDRQTSVPVQEKNDAPSSTTVGMSQREAKLIGIISTFLHVHPFGASVHYIQSYLEQLKISIRSSEIEDLLEKLPDVFKQDLQGVGASIEKLWKFTGFNVLTGTA